jgi:hypothetical protein
MRDAGRTAFLHASRITHQIFMDVILVDLKAILAEKLSKLSQKETLIVIYIHHRNAVLGALTQLLQINLADVLLGKASIENADVLLLLFPEYSQAKEIFEKIPEDWHVEGEDEIIHVELWHRGRREAENQCIHGPSDLFDTAWLNGRQTIKVAELAI